MVQSPMHPKNPTKNALPLVGIATVCNSVKLEALVGVGVGVALGVLALEIV